MGIEEDAALVRKGYEAFIAGDMEWMNEHLHENVVWHVPGHNTLSGDYKGRENVLAFFIRSLSIALPEFDIHDVAASTEHVVALLSITWRRTEGEDTFADRSVQVFHLDNGRAIEVWTMQGDPAGFDAFIGSA